jgi:LysR family transcriptional regulator, regulator of abg operon
MEHRQIELFLAIAERLNISQAADAMNITQPGLSKSMYRLQRELGTKLYDRRGRGIELTEAGEALLRHGKVIKTQLADAHVELAGIASGVLGHLRIGAGPSWLSRHLPESIANIMKLHPKLRFTVKAGFSDNLVSQLRSGGLDVVIGALPENRTDPDLRFVRLTADTTHVIGRANHPLLAKPKRNLVDYTSYGWVLPARQEALQQRLLKAFRMVGQEEPTAVVETDSLSLIFATLRLTDCLGMVTSQTLLLEEARGIVPVDHERLRFSREAGIIMRRHINLSPFLRLLTAELRRIAAKRVDN